MPDYTLKNKSHTPTATLSPRVMAALLAAPAEASSLAIGKLCQDYKVVSGKTLHIAPEQQAQLLQRYQAREDGTWTSQFVGLPPVLHAVKDSFVRGFLAQDVCASVCESLDTAQAFYAMLEREMQRQVQVAPSDSARTV